MQVSMADKGDNTEMNGKIEAFYEALLAD